MASQTRARLNNLNDRAREFAGPTAPQLSLSDARAVIAHYNHTCLSCGTTPAISIDHVVPLSKGGLNRIDNLQLLCTECNKRKGTEDTDYRNGNIVPIPLSELYTENKGKIRQRKPGGGRKPLEVTIAKRRLRAERVEDAQEMLDMLTAWAKTDDFAPEFRRACANDVLDRVLGKPNQMAANEADELQAKYLENVKRVIFGGGEPGSVDAPEGVQPGFDAVYAAIRANTGSPSTN